MIRKIFPFILLQLFISTSSYANNCLDHIDTHIDHQKLDLSYCSLTAQDIPIIVNFLKNHSQINDLNISYNNIGDTGVLQLSQASALRSLEIAYAHISTTGAIILASNYYLTSLDISGNDLKDTAYAFSQNRHLIALTLCNVTIPPHEIAMIVSNPYLRSIDLQLTVIDDLVMQALARHHHLENLAFTALEYTSPYGDLHLFVSDEAMTYMIENNPTLKTLNLGYRSFSHSNNDNPFPSALAALSKLPKLEALQFTGSNLNDQDVIAISKIKTLKELDVTGNKKIGPAGAAALSKLPALEKLIISFNEIGDEGAIALSQSQSLKSLNVGFSLANRNDNNITERGYIALAKNHHLEYVFFGGIGVETIKALSTNKNLKAAFFSCLRDLSYKEREIYFQTLVQLIKNDTLNEINLVFDGTLLSLAESTSGWDFISALEKTTTLRKLVGDRTIQFKEFDQALENLPNKNPHIKTVILY